MIKILLVEDSIELCSSLHEVFSRLSYSLQSVRCIYEAYDRLATQKYDLIIIDRHLPDGDGLEILEYMNSTLSVAPILMLTQKNSLGERLSGLRLGADDYLGKPFCTDELILRSENLLKKIKKVTALPLKVGAIELFEESVTVKIHEKVIKLRRKEFFILSFLIHHHDTLVTRQMLIDNVWNQSSIPTYSTIDVYIRRIRVILGKEQECIQTVRTYGYTFKSTPSFKMTTPLAVI